MPGWPVRTPAGRPRHVQPRCRDRDPASNEVAHELPSVSTVTTVMGPAAQARSILSHQPPSVASGVPLLPGPGPCPVGPVRTSVGRPRHVPGLGPGWLVPSHTSDRQLHRRRGRTPKPVLHPQSTVPVTRTWRAGPTRLGPWQAVTGLCVFYRTPGRNCCNVHVGHSSPFGNLFRRGHFLKEETVETVSEITRLYKKPQRSNENKTQGALLVRRCIVRFVPPAQPP